MVTNLIQNLIVNEINDIIDDVFTFELPNALIQYESIDASPVRSDSNLQSNMHKTGFFLVFLSVLYLKSNILFYDQKV